MASSHSRQAVFGADAQQLLRLICFLKDLPIPNQRNRPPNRHQRPRRYSKSSLCQIFAPLRICRYSPLYVVGGLKPKRQRANLHFPSMDEAAMA